MRIAVIGAGISGIAAAHILTKCGHDVVVFEKSTELGGVWVIGYPGVRLQNTRKQYRISDIPWPFKPDLHPTSRQIREYLNQAVADLQLDVRRNHEVREIVENGEGWVLTYDNGETEHNEAFEFIVVASGQYTEGKHKPRLSGQEIFKGEVITERDVGDLDVFDNKRTVIVGFGKSAVDMATFAVQRVKQVHHVFRTPRWMVPFRILGFSYTKFLFSRIGTIIMPSWAYPTSFERWLHEKLRFLISAIWKLLKVIYSGYIKSRARFFDKAALERLRAVLPDHDIVGDLRSALSMAPENYFENVATGKILPYHSEMVGLTETGLLLKDGRTVECDQVMLCVGSKTPAFPFLPDKYRRIMEAENDGIQLYRHLLHPRIPNLAFAGFNHCFMHVPAVEVATLWLSAWLEGELRLPPADEMEQSMKYLRDWKRDHINYEPSLCCATNTRFQQYIDIMLKDLGVSPYRKMPNVFAELFSEYGAADYAAVLDDYRNVRETTALPREVMEVDT